MKDKTFEPIGLPDDVPPLETEVIAQAISTYNKSARLAVADYALTDPAWTGIKRFGIIYVAEYPSTPALPRINGEYPDPRDSTKTITRFRENDILVRRNAQTCTADEKDHERLARRAHGGNKELEPLEVRTPDEQIALPGMLPAREEIAVNFVGRQKELNALTAWFMDPNSRVWLLSGDGGKGKSAIAYEFASQVRVDAPSGYSIVIWLSAKQRRFVEGQIRPTAAPDFWDLPSLLDTIARAYGYIDDMTLAERRAQVEELLNVLPALLVIDDIDSIDPEHQDTFTFLMALMRTPTKVLFTSRRVLFGLNTVMTQVIGLKGGEGGDGHAFITSRLDLLQLDRALFGPRMREKILAVTDGSPLYIEDLLRLCKTSRSPDHAISSWEKQDGDAVRAYALQRELETLSPYATEILIACCLPGGPVSFAEIQDITGLSEDTIRGSLSELQTLFLVSSPRLIEDVQRFDVNSNTRMLVARVFIESDQWRRLGDAYKRVSGQQNIRAHREIGNYIRQATSLQNLGQHETAEKTIEAALEQFVDNPDLIAQLGVIYVRWAPYPRLTDARAKFERAAQLKCGREFIYDIWAWTEIGAGEFTAGARAAKIGRDRIGDTMLLLYREGYARSRLGQELRSSLHPSRAEQELTIADELLRAALKDPETLTGFEERRLNSQIFRALVLNYETLGKVDEMYRTLDRWQREHPTDPIAQDLGQRLRVRYARP